jgi:hypothetical protein
MALMVVSPLVIGGTSKLPVSGAEPECAALGLRPACRYATRSSTVKQRIPSRLRFRERRMRSAAGERAAEIIANSSSCILDSALPSAGHPSLGLIQVADRLGSEILALWSPSMF